MSCMISKRGEFAKDWQDFMKKYSSLCIEDPYDEKKNPQGYVNLGTAVNNMCEDVIIPRLSSKEVWYCDPSLLQYKEGYGILRLREAFASLMTEMLEAHEAISPENLICLCGVTSCIDILAHCLADPGDVFLVPTPMYGRIYTDIKQRALVDMQQIYVITEDNTEDVPQLTMEKINKAYEKAIAEKRVVRALFLVNPTNPFGDIYSPQLLMDMLSFCHSHSLHFIIDELYALSVYSKSEKFHSVLKFNKIPDPERTHVLYGLSKDFGLPGLRIGVIHTTCEPLKMCLYQLCFFQNIPFTMMEIVTRYLEDREWVKKYLSINQEHMAENFNLCMDYMKKMGLKARDASAGFYLWVDFRNICGTSFEQEMHFFEYLIEKFHLYIVPGKEFYCAQPGWFRIVFTRKPQYVKEGLSRLEKAIKEYKPLKV